jgi:hypothetical protein
MFTTRQILAVKDKKFWEEVISYITYRVSETTWTA